MSKYKNWSPGIENKPSNYDDSETFIVKSWQHDQTGQSVSIMRESKREFPDNPYYIEVQAYGTYAEYSSADEAKTDAGKLLHDHPNGIGEMREGLPKDAQITFKLGSPVKAGEYYSSKASGFVDTSDLDHDLYGIGTSTTSKGVRHSSDLRNVQAYSSTVMFVYSRGGELTHEELMQVLGGQSVYGTQRFDQVYIYRDGRAIPALKTGAQGGRSSHLRLIVKDYDEGQEYETNLSPEKAEDIGSFSVFT